jgi:hypothetical protein
MSYRGTIAMAIGAVLAFATSAASAQRCAEPDLNAPWARVNAAWADETALRWSNDSLRRELIVMARADQAERADFGAKWNDSVYVKKLVEADSLRSVALERILDRFGIPTRDMVGPRGADAAMLIVQHSAWLQPRMLRLAKAAPSGQISAEALALMEDRLLVAEGKRQTLPPP